LGASFCELAETRWTVISFVLFRNRIILPGLKDDKIRNHA
jgi:hypothetical protein